MGACCLCARPLHFWILVQCALELLQAASQLGGLLNLRKAIGDDRRLQQCIQEITQSALRKPNKVVAAFSFAWFALGFTWLSMSRFCKPCPGLFFIALALWLVTVAQVAVAVGLIVRYFPDRGFDDAGPTALEGVAPEVVKTLPLVKFASEDGWCETSCSICLGDFEEGELLRELPCGHKFHGQCVDKWLEHHRTCPLCIHDVQAPPPRSVQRFAKNGTRGCCSAVGCKASRLDLCGV